MPPILNAAKLRHIREKQGELAYERELQTPWKTEEADLALLVEIVHRHAEQDESEQQGPMPDWFIEASRTFMERYGRNRGAAILLKTLARLNRPLMGG